MKLDVAAFREHLGKLADGVTDETLAQWNEACRWLAEQARAAIAVAEGEPSADDVIHTGNHR